MLDDIFAGLDQDPSVSASPKSEARTFTAEPGRLTTAADALAFICGGRATFTVRSTKTGTRFTFRVRLSDDKRMRFVSVLTGPDDYTYLGHVHIGRDIYFHGRKSRVTEDAPSNKAFAWVWRELVRDNMPPTLEVWHEGACGRCGRRLTVPESIASGFGPECITRIGE